MPDIEVSKESILKEHKLKDFNVVEYSKKVFRMYSKDPVNVELEFESSLINVFINRFGKEVTIHSKTETAFHISVEVALAETFLGWLLMFGNKVKTLVQRQSKGGMKEHLASVMETYEL